MNPRLIVYKASAGSGKTFTLAAEYVALLLMQPEGNEYRRILAVTFTNMATSEMKDRIITSLYGLSVGAKGIEDFREKVRDVLAEATVKMTDEQMQAKAKRCLSAMLHDYDCFRVETIDSFFQSILRNLARELGLNAGLQVELDDSQLVDRAVDRIIENLPDDNQNRVKKVITQLMEARLNEGRSWDVTSTVKSFARCIFDEAFQNRSEKERAALSDEDSLSRFTSVIYAIRQNAVNLLDKKIEETRQVISSQTLDFSRISRGSDYASLLDHMSSHDLEEKKSATLNKVKELDGNILLKSQDKSNSAMQTMASQTIELLNETYEAYRYHLREINTADITLKYIGEMSLLGHIEQAVEDICEENNQFSLSKTPTLLHQLIGQDDAPFVLEKAGTQLSHVMIDEFQDTSRMQWQNFKVLLADNLAQGGHDLLVGDVKQSIYRWRNGDWKILQGIDKMESMPIRPETRKLSVNRRSNQNIVIFNNSFFKAAASELDVLGQGDETIANIYSDVHQTALEKATGGYVRIRLFREMKKNDENYQQLTAEDMSHQIKELLANGLQPEDIAILVRTHADCDTLIHQFARLAPDICLVSDEAFLLESSTAVQMIISSLRVITQGKEQDPVSMRYLCLHYLPEEGKVMPTCNELFTKEPEKILPEAFISQLEQLSSMPLYLTCETLVRIFRLNQWHGQASYLTAFFDELQNHLRSNPSDITTFLRTWDETIHKRPIPSGKIKGVRVITIHKSKGLQFHTVLIPAVHWDIEREQRNEKVWCRSDNNSYNALGDIRIDLQPRLRNSHYEGFFNEERFQRRVDNLNLLYVAFTRAKKNLMIWGLTQYKRKVTEKPDEMKADENAVAGDLLCLYLLKEMRNKTADEEESFIFQCGTPVGREEEETAHKSEDLTEKDLAERMGNEGKSLELEVNSYEPRLNFRQSNDSQKFIHTVNNKEQVEFTQTYTDIGKLMHYVLSKIRTSDDIKHILEECQVQGLIEDKKMEQTVINRLTKGFMNPTVKSWFSTDSECINEANIIGQSTLRPGQNVHRPDRVIITDDTITVVDYKFARPIEEHRIQVRAYMELLQQMYPKMNVKGYLWYVYPNKVEPV